MTEEYQKEFEKNVSDYTRMLVKGYDRIGTYEDVLNKVILYFSSNKIQKAVIGVSGGVDSALALAILDRVSKHVPLEVVAVEITFSMFDDVYDKKYVDILQEKYKDVTWFRFDMSNSANTIKQESEFPLLTDIMGDVAYALRYNMLFAIAKSIGGITVGTTNKDEISAAWYGIHSDMNVDLQFLWNLPKCVIKDFAKRIEVPEEIVNRTPTGDLLSGKTDEEIFGCTYNELRYWFDICSGEEQNDFIKKKYEKLSEHMEKNSYKFKKPITEYTPVFL